MSKRNTLISVGDNTYYSKYTVAGIQRAMKAKELIPIEDKETGSFGYLNSVQEHLPIFYTALDAS